MEVKSKAKFNPWPVAIISYFAVFIAFTVCIVAYLSRQKMDLVRGDYYDDEIRYQEQLDRMNRTQRLATGGVVAYDTNAQSITISLPSVRSQSPATGRIRLYRPSDESLDRDVTLAVGPDGVQKLSAKNLRAGLWKVRVYWTVDGKDYFFGETVVVSPTRA